MSDSFGPFSFDRVAGALTRDGKPVALGTRGAALLAALIEGDGAPVGKEALIEAGWPGAVVEEGNLSVQIATLRKTLGPRPDGQDWIATVPRVGYRLLKVAAPTTAEPAAPVLPSLAVLPFANLSGDPEQEYFADGIVDDIITALSRFKSFAVIARNSSFTYKGRAVDVREVAKDLGVRYVLEGSVRKAGNRLRIVAQLIDAGSGAHLFAQTFDGVLEDIFDFQDRLAEGVVATVVPQIQQAEIDRSRRERPHSLAAHDLFLRALPLILAGEEDNRQAIALLTEASELEPDRGILLACLARALGVRVFWGWPSSGYDQTMLGYAERALRHAHDDATVISMCADTLLHARQDYRRALDLALQAVELNPNNFHAVSVAGIVTLHCGDLNEAGHFFDRALRLNPRDPEVPLPLVGLAHIATVRSDFATAIELSETVVARNDRYAPAYWILTAAHALLGHAEEARHYLAEVTRVAPGATIASIRATQPDYDPSRIKAILDGLRLAGLPED